MEIVRAIALLCQIHSGQTGIAWIQEEQQKCQKQLAECYLRIGKYDTTLLKCIAERK